MSKINNYDVKSVFKVHLRDGTTDNFMINLVGQEAVKEINKHFGRRVIKAFLLGFMVNDEFKAVKY